MWEDTLDEQEDIPCNIVTKKTSISLHTKERIDVRETKKPGSGNKEASVGKRDFAFATPRGANTAYALAATATV